MGAPEEDRRRLRELNVLAAGHCAAGRYEAAAAVRTGGRRVYGRLRRGRPGHPDRSRQPGGHPAAARSPRLGAERPGRERRCSPPGVRRPASGHASCRGGPGRRLRSGGGRSGAGAGGVHRGGRTGPSGNGRAVHRAGPAVRPPRAAAGGGPHARRWARTDHRPGSPAAPRRPVPPVAARSAQCRGGRRDPGRPRRSGRRATTPGARFPRGTA